MHLKMSSVKWRPFCSEVDELRACFSSTVYTHGWWRPGDARINALNTLHLISNETGARVLLRNYHCGIKQCFVHRFYRHLPPWFNRRLNNYVFYQCPLQFTKLPTHNVMRLLVIHLITLDLVYCRLPSWAPPSARAPSTMPVVFGTGGRAGGGKKLWSEISSILATKCIRKYLRSWAILFIQASLY